jgi:hypothetical protein
MILYELVTGKHAFADEESYDPATIKAIYDNPFNPLPEKLSPFLKELITKLL